MNALGDFIRAIEDTTEATLALEKSATRLLDSFRALAPPAMTLATTLPTGLADLISLLAEVETTDAEAVAAWVETVLGRLDCARSGLMYLRTQMTEAAPFLDASERQAKN